MYDLPEVEIPIQMRDWVFAVEPGPNRRQRAAIEIAPVSYTHLTLPTKA